VYIIFKQSVAFAFISYIVKWRVSEDFSTDCKQLNTVSFDHVNGHLTGENMPILPIQIQVTAAFKHVETNSQVNPPLS